MFMYIKGYDITLINKRSLKKLRLSPAMQAVIDTDTLKAQMEAVLEENGRIYALYRKKELVACYLFAKRKTTNCFLKEEDRGRVRQAADLTVYELTHCYHTPETEMHQNVMEQAFLQDLRELCLLQGVDAILWGERYFLPQWWEDNAKSGMITGIALGLLFGLITDHLLLGLLLGLALPSLLGWGRHYRKPETEEVMRCR